MSEGKGKAKGKLKQHLFTSCEFIYFPGSLCEVTVCRINLSPEGCPSLGEGPTYFGFHTHGRAVQTHAKLCQGLVERSAPLHRTLCSSFFDSFKKPRPVGEVV